MSIVAESAPNQIHVGAACANARNQVFTVIGFNDKQYSAVKEKPHEISLSLEFDPQSKRSNVYGLYYDQSNPERQEIIDCFSHECKFVRDINEGMLLMATKGSPFFDSDVVKHFLRILQGAVTCESPFTQSLLRNYLLRGFNSCISILHHKYLQFLSEAGLSKELFAFIVNGASNGSEPVKDVETTTLTQAEIKID